MSSKAIDWATEYAPPMPSELLPTLTALAKHADSKGCGAYPSVPRLAALACKSERSVQRDLKRLLALDLIRIGDRRLTQHLPAGKRPEVYDLALEKTVPGGRAGPDEVTSTSLVTLASSRARGKAAREAKKASSQADSSSATGDVDVRGDAHVTGDVHVADGVTPTSSEGRRPRHPKQEPEPTTEQKNTAASPKSATNPDAFDAFWGAYPRKIAKAAARKAHAAALKRGATPEQLLAAIGRHADNWRRCRTEQRFIPHASTWLNQERYEDEIEPPQNGQRGGARADIHTHEDYESGNVEVIL